MCVTMISHATSPLNPLVRGVGEVLENKNSSFFEREVATRITFLAVGSLFSTLATAHQAGSAVVKTPCVAAYVLTGWIPIGKDSEGKWCFVWDKFSSDFTLLHELIHLGKITLYAFCIILVPFVGVVSPSLCVRSFRAISVGLPKRQYVDLSAASSRAPEIEFNHEIKEALRKRILIPGNEVTSEGVGTAPQTRSLTSRPQPTPSSPARSSGNGSYTTPPSPADSTTPPSTEAPPRQHRNFATTNPYDVRLDTLLEGVRLRHVPENERSRSVNNDPKFELHNSVRERARIWQENYQRNPIGNLERNVGPSTIPDEAEIVRNMQRHREANQESSDTSDPEWDFVPTNNAAQWESRPSAPPSTPATDASASGQSARSNVSPDIAARSAAFQNNAGGQQATSTQQETAQSRPGPTVSSAQGTAGQRSRGLNGYESMEAYLAAMQARREQEEEQEDAEG